jgi:hypothetical protein
VEELREDDASHWMTQKELATYEQEKEGAQRGKRCCNASAEWVRTAEKLAQGRKTMLPL